MLRSELVYRMTHDDVYVPGTVPYEMGVHDCSSYVSKILGIERQDTVSIVANGYIFEININDLRPGDMYGHCGPNTYGPNGHIGFFSRWLNQDPNDNHYWGWELAGGETGPNENFQDWPIAYYKAYRFKDVVEDPTPPPVVPYVTVVPFTTPNPDWRSTLSGIAGHEGTTVSALVALNPFITNPDVIQPGWHIRTK